MAEFRSARSETIPPLPWTNFSPPFPGADAVADGGGGDAELLAGQHEALVVGGGLEEAQAVERGKWSTAKVRREPIGKT